VSFVRHFVILCVIVLKLNLPAGRQARRTLRYALRHTKDFLDSPYISLKKSSMIYQ